MNTMPFYQTKKSEYMEKEEYICRYHNGNHILCAIRVTELAAKECAKNHGIVLCEKHRPEN